MAVLPVRVEQARLLLRRVCLALWSGAAAVVLRVVAGATALAAMLPARLPCALVEGTSAAHS